MDDILSHPLLQSLLAVVAGALYAFIFWQQRWRTAQKASEGTITSSVGWPWLWLALVVHLASWGVPMFAGPMEGQGEFVVRFSFAIAVSLMAWLAVAVVLMEARRISLAPFLPYILPLAASAALMTVVFPRTHPLPFGISSGVVVHFLASMLAYGLLTLAALQALFMYFAERHLHRREIGSIPTGMPPLMTLETLLFRLLGIGFVFLTLAVGSGLFFSEQVFGHRLRVDHKIVFSIVAWLIFAVLLLGRWLRGWRGKVAVRWTLSGFSLLLLGYVGSRFVLEVLLQR